MIERPTARARAARLCRTGRECVLTVGALLGVLCLVATSAAMALDVRPVIFRSGSMSPAIETGALALSRTTPASELAVGDVVTVRNSEDVLVTHRIRSLSRSGDDATLVLKGDDNAVADPEPFVVQSARRVLVDVPRLGYVVSALTGPAGVFGGGLLVGLALPTVFGRRRGDDDTHPPGSRDPGGTCDTIEQAGSSELDVADDVVDPGTPASAVGASGGGEGGQSVAPDAVAAAGASLRRQHCWPEGRLVLPALLMVVGAAGAMSSTSTSAVFTDTAAATTGTFTMRVPPAAAPAAPVVRACVRESGNRITLTWNNVPGATGYRVAHTDPAGTQTVTSAADPVVWTSANVNFNATGTIRVFAVNATEDSPASNAFAYSGNGANAVCNPVP